MCNSRRFDEFYNRVRNQIDSLVETDPTAFYTYDEYETAADIFYETVMLRFESIEGQLSGQIPSTDEGQRKDSSSLIDASHLDLKLMGEFDMGGNSGGSEKSISRDSSQEDSDKENNSGSTDKNNRPDGFDKEKIPGDFQKGGMPGGISPDSVPEGFGGPQSSNNGSKMIFGICFVVMISSLLIMKKYKRRKYRASQKAGD